MFKDVELSAELMAQFETHRAAAQHAASKPSAGAGAGAGSGSASASGPLPAICDISVHVLTSSNWPAYTPAPVILPPEVRASADVVVLRSTNKVCRCCS